MRNKTYYIFTIGCQMNKSDSERVAGYLDKLGYGQAKKRQDADLVVLNTCGVRQSAEDRVYGLVPRIKKDNPKTRIILTGCLSEREDVIRKLKNWVDIWLPIRELSALSENLEVRSKKLGDNYLKIKPKYNSGFSAFVPIGNGCDNFCAYCVVPYARGREVYRDAGEILEEVRELTKRGYKEIVLIAQNVNSYISRIATNLSTNSRESNHKWPRIKTNSCEREYVNFARLLRMVDDVDGDFWIRFATSHPKDMSDELIKAIKECDKVCEHVHLALQSGDNEILRRMNRKYTVEQYKELIGKIRDLTRMAANEARIATNLRTNSHENWQAPAAVTTDVIVGFPGESEEQFNNTVKLFKEIKFDMAYIAQYSPRPGTAAAKLKDNVSKAEKKQREMALTEILKQTALENNKKYLGKTVQVLVEGKNKKGEWYGKTRTNKSVKVRSGKLPPEADQLLAKEVRSVNLIGKFIYVKIKEVKDFGLAGVVDTNSH